MTSSTLGELTKALIIARQAFPAIPKTKTAQAGSYSYKYADLGDIIAAVVGPLADQGLVFMQPIAMRGERSVVETRLMHVSGEWIASECPFTTHDKPQETGSAITYARRYSLTALLGIAADEDDDGQAAQKKAPKSKGKIGEVGGDPKAAVGMKDPTDLARANVVSTATAEGIEPTAAKRLLAGWFQGVSASKDLDENQCKAAIEGFQNYGKTLREIAELAQGLHTDEEVLLIASAERTDPIKSLQELSLDELRGVRDELKLRKAAGTQEALV